MSTIPPLIAGPYAAPRMRAAGDRLPCRIQGDVPVDGMSDGPIPWPYTRYRGQGVPRSPMPVLILCADLERAVRTESVAAVAYHWGVSRTPVGKWRAALGVGRMTAGTRAAVAQHARWKLTDLAPKIAAIRKAIAAGKSNMEIGLELGVPRRTVWRVRRGDIFAD